MPYYERTQNFPEIVFKDIFSIENENKIITMFTIATSLLFILSIPLKIYLSYKSFNIKINFVKCLDIPSLPQSRNWSIEALLEDQTSVRNYRTIYIKPRLSREIGIFLMHKIFNFPKISQ